MTNVKKLIPRRREHIRLPDENAYVTRAELAEAIEVLTDHFGNVLTQQQELITAQHQLITDMAKKLETECKS